MSLGHPSFSWSARRCIGISLSLMVSIAIDVADDTQTLGWVTCMDCISELKKGDCQEKVNNPCYGEKSPGNIFLLEVWIECVSALVQAQDPNN